MTARVDGPPAGQGAGPPDRTAPVWAIVVAGGSGSRFGARKQYARLDGKRILDWSLESARLVCDGVVLVLPADDVARGAVLFPADAVVAGGATRSDSVRAGLAAVPASAGVIAVHDAARPLAAPEVWEATVEAILAGADGAIPTVPVTDTVKTVGADGVLTTLDRSRLVAVQTPQAFRASSLRAAHADGADATDDAALVEAVGGRVVQVSGHPHNLKVTHPDDLLVAAALLPVVRAAGGEVTPAARYGEATSLRRRVSAGRGSAPSRPGRAR